jgi:hypothetical protein
MTEPTVPKRRTRKPRAAAGTDAVPEPVADAADPVAPAQAPSAPEPEGSQGVTAAPPPSATERDPSDGRPGTQPGELVLALSPRQIVGGFALLAGLILLARRRGRRRR